MTIKIFLSDLTIFGAENRAEMTFLGADFREWPNRLHKGAENEQFLTIFGAENYSKMTISGAENRQNGSIKVQKLTVFDVIGAQFTLDL